jgi:hypothetical protein
MSISLRKEEIQISRDVVRMNLCFQKVYSCIFDYTHMQLYGFINCYPHVYVGMSDNMSFSLGNAGYKAYKYVPYGKIQEVMPYLIRRAQENSDALGITFVVLYHMM